ncbi:MAG: DNA translocase FtsK, partial [Candidatus Eisenbacteria sp.]|nr:DNA translocase FtsK [Candidatus Eisenbacteria bacterium]
ARIDLLDDTATAARPVSEDEIRGNAVLLKETLASFGISGEVSEVQPGPVITRYEFTPGSGVTISQIVSRQDDLALAMRAPRVRLLAPIPGKAAVGVEIPNRQPAVIYFREVAALRAFRDAREPLFMALGKDVAGRPFYASLDKMPHLLVAGTTGSGKSVCLNTLIVSLLMRCTPDELRLVMIDPKMLELTMFNGIPHLVRPVVTENQEAVRCLRWLTREMERRYRALAGLGVRNISAYQSRRRDSRGEARLPMMPYIVVFVDELADLMIANQSEVEVPITRLAQMARAVGIHLVLATQRPSVDIITGVIKANFPARIAFQVATKIDSRTVLDMNGAESLLGRGDMLYIPPGKAQAHRIHGAFLSDAEIERITSYLRQFPPAEPLQMPEPEGVDLKEGGPMEDPLFNEARRIVVASQQGSTSLLQRRLRIGYTRAGRLIDMLERSGIVGPPDGSRAREVLVPVQSLEEETARSERMEP